LSSRDVQDDAMPAAFFLSFAVGMRRTHGGYAPYPRPFQINKFHFCPLFFSIYQRFDCFNGGKYALNLQFCCQKYCCLLSFRKFYMQPEAHYFQLKPSFVVKDLHLKDFGSKPNPSI